MLALILGIFILLITPAMYDGLSVTPRLRAWADVVISLAMVYVLAAHVAPEIFALVRYQGVLVATLGFVGMTLIERLCHGKFESIHRAALIFVFCGFAIHVALDGLALSHSHDSTQSLSSLGLAILLHRLPVALLVWAKLYPLIGRAKAFSILVLMALVSVVGFVTGEYLFQSTSHHGQLAYMEALIAGCLFHVVVHQFSVLKQLFNKTFSLRFGGKT